MKEGIFGLLDVKPYHKVLVIKTISIFTLKWTSILVVQHRQSRNNSFICGNSVHDKVLKRQAIQYMPLGKVAVYLKK